MGKVREAMRPEFLNRIDEIVLFQKLDQNSRAQVAVLLPCVTAPAAGPELRLEH